MTPQIDRPQPDRPQPDRPQPDRPQTAETYPRHREADVVASDGGIVHLRPILATDADALRRFHAGLSERTRYLRYFGPYPRISDRDLERFTVVDHHTRVALVCLLGDDIIAVGRYEGLPAAAGTPRSAEVAFVASDRHQGRGLGSILLEHLAAAAQENGVGRFEAEVLAENHTMIRVFRQAGYQVSRAFADGVVHLEFDVDPTESSMAVRDAREQRAEARSVHNALHPSSVAVIGASTDPAKIGHAVFANLLRGSLRGPVFPVNPDARSVRGVRAYASVTDIPDPVDLAVVAVPAADIDQVMDDCLAKGVTTLVVVSAGFADAGEVVAERRLVAEARAHGMRVIGPNALGVANTDPDVCLNATLAPDVPGRGRVGFFSQSGALGIAILAAARERGLGLSTFVSAGNRADVSGNDLLQYWQTDADTDVVLLYLESFGNPRKFARLARRLARTKPIVAVKSGRHTGPAPGLAASAAPIDESSVRALFEQAGVIRVETLSELFDTALVLAHQPLPAGDRVAVVGNSGALGLLVTDALLDEGMELAGDPVDVGVTAGPDRFAAAARAALYGTGGTTAHPVAPQGDPSGRGGAADGAPGHGVAPADALIAVFVPPIATPGAAYARALREAVADMGKPVVAVFVAAEGVPPELAVPGADGTPAAGSVPSFPSPERAAAALARVSRYARWRARPVGDFTAPDGIDSERARTLVAGWVDRSGSAPGSAPDAAPVPSPTPWTGHPEPRRPPAGRALTDDEAVELLECYGIPLVAFRRVAGAAAAVAAAEDLGYPVAVKSAADRWRHRSDQIGVRLDIDTAQGVRRAHTDLAGLTGTEEIHVQRMVRAGVSCVLEIVDDPSFGSLLSFGLSGTASELLGDRAFRVVPVSDADAAALVRAPRAAPLLAGYRGAEPTDLEALQELVRRVGRMAEDLPEIRSLALEPVLASARGVAVTGARVVLGPPPHRDDHGPRRLR